MRLMDSFWWQQAVNSLLLMALLGIDIVLLVRDKEYVDDIVFAVVWLWFNLHMTFHVFTLWRKLQLQERGVFKGYPAM